MAVSFLNWKRSELPYGDRRIFSGWISRNRREWRNASPKGDALSLINWREAKETFLVSTLQPWSYSMSKCIPSGRRVYSLSLCFYICHLVSLLLLGYVFLLLHVAFVLLYCVNIFSFIFFHIIYQSIPFIYQLRNKNILCCLCIFLKVDLFEIFNMLTMFQCQ